MPSSVCDARAARARSFPGTLEPGRLILAERRIRGSHQRRDRESARPPRLHQGEPGPDRVVERSLHVAGDDRVPFLRRGAHRPRSIGATLDGGARRRSGSVDPAASRARSRAGDDPRGVRRQERPVRGDPRRARDVRLSPGVPSAYTQPLYGWFLAGLYLPFDRSWLAVGLAQIAVAVATALLVLEIGVRLRPGVGLVAALSRRFTRTSSGTTSTRIARCSTGSYWRCSCCARCSRTRTAR